MSYYTAIILPKGGNIIANSMMTNQVIVIENYGQLAHKLRGRGINKAVLVNMKKGDLDSEIQDTLKRCGMTFSIETGTEIPYLEV